MSKGRTPFSSTPSTQDWIQSERRPQRPKTIQTRLVLHDLLDNNNVAGPTSNQPVLTFASAHKRSIRKMDKDENIAVSANTRSKGRNKVKDEAKGKEQDKDSKGDANMTNPEALSAIQEKLSKFQPKIDSILPRMLNKGGATTATKATPSEKQSGSAAKPDQPRESDATIATAADSSRRPTATTDVTSIETEPSPSPSRTKAKKRASGPLTSVATLIPKGSRAKPLPQKVEELAVQAPPIEQAIRVGDQPEQAIILSSLPSLHSLPSLVEIDDIQREGPEASNGKGNHPHPSDETPSIETRVDDQHVQDTQTVKKAAAMKIPSIISIDSFRSDDGASIIPSIQVDRITNWVGTVKEAMERDNSQYLRDTVTPEPTINTTPVNKSSTSAGETTIVAGAQKPILRRPPPMIPRHAAPASSSPSPSPQRTTRSPLVIESSLESSSTTEDDVEKNKCTTTKDTVASLPPVPLFNEMSEVDEVQVKAIGLPTTTTAIEPTSARAVASRPSYHEDDDRSTVVGGQPTQDSIAGFASLPSFAYENNNDHDLDETEEESWTQMRQGLPSGLTSSCLQELGILKRKNSTDRSDSGKRRNGSSGNTTQEDGAQDEDGGDIVILAQRDVFPESLGEAPASLSFPSDSCQVLEAPKYTFALPDRTRQDQPIQPSIQSETTQELDEWGAPRIQQGQRPVQGVSISYHLPSFPSPPSQTSFSTLPTMPTFPNSFPSEPQASYEHEQGQEGEEALARDQDQCPTQEHHHEANQDNHSHKLSFPSPPSQTSFSILPTMPTFPSELNSQPSVIVIDSQTPSQEDEL